MATCPDYNLQDPYTIADEALAAQIAAIADENERADAKYTAQWAQWRNKAVADLYYPGSVFKVITASAALDSGAANLNTSYTCKGSITVAGRTMRCAPASTALDYSAAWTARATPTMSRWGR